MESTWKQQPSLAIVDDTEYILISPFEFQWSKGGVDFRLIVPENFNTDIASSPQITWSLGFKPDGLHRAAAVVHDYMYVKGGVLPPGTYQCKNAAGWVNLETYWPRRQADDLFYKMMIHYGVPYWRAKTMWLAVRAFGWAFWAR